MLKEIKSAIAVVALAFAVTPKAKADYVFPFTYTIPNAIQFSVSGDFTVDSLGALESGDFTSWDVQIVAPDGILPTLTLTPSNSTFTIYPNTDVMSSSQALTFLAQNANQGFGFTGTVTSGSSSYPVEWFWGPDGESIVSVTDDGQPVYGATTFPFPAIFATGAELGGVGASPVPEPSSVLLLGSGGIFLMTAGIRRLSGDKCRSQNCQH
jgi:hypothetical protein